MSRLLSSQALGSSHDLPPGHDSRPYEVKFSRHCLGKIPGKTALGSVRICEILDSAQEGTRSLNSHLGSEACLSSSRNLLFQINHSCC